MVVVSIINNCKQLVVIRDKTSQTKAHSGKTDAYCVDWLMNNRCLCRKNLLMSYAEKIFLCRKNLLMQKKSSYAEKIFLGKVKLGSWLKFLSVFWHWELCCQYKSSGHHTTCGESLVLPPKQIYENENENKNRFRNRGKTTSVDTRKRETQTEKLNLVVFGFDTLPQKKPLVWTFGFENCKAWTNQRAVCCTTWLRVVSRDTEVGFVPGSCWILDQNLQKLSVVCSKEHGFRRTKTVFETVGLYSPLV